MTRDILQAALEEFYRVGDRLRTNPDFQRHEALRHVIELYQKGAARPGQVDLIVPSTLPANPVPSESSSRTGRPINSEMALSRPVAAPDRPPSRRRGGWTKGNSKSSRIRDAAIAYLREIKRPASGGEICRAIVAKGVEVGGTKPQAYVSSQLTGSHLFYRADQGYALSEWLNGEARAPDAPVSADQPHR